MKKYIISIILFTIVLGIILIFIFLNQNSFNKVSNTLINKQNKQSIKENSYDKDGYNKIIETEIANSSTPILIEDDNRNINLELCCKQINEYIIKVGEEFSFNNVVGNPIPEKGYKKANIFVKGGQEKGYGGGNCQVSSTLYNAVTKIPDLEITEHHGHNRDVGYIEQGKDATVVYDDLDLKFKNNTKNDIKIYAEAINKEIKIKLMKIES